MIGLCALAVFPAASAAAAPGWDPPRELSTPASAPLGLAAAAGVDPRGGAVVLWHAEPGVEAVVRAAGHGFGKPRPIAGSKLSMPDVTPRIAIDPRGAAVAVWSYFEPHPRFVEDGYSVEYTFGLRAAGRAPAGGFGRAQTLTDQLDSDPNADVAIDPTGTAVVLWTDAAGMHAAARPAGSRRFGRAQVVGSTQADPQVSVGAEGAKIASWSGPGAARVAVSGDGSSFRRATTLAIEGLGNATPVLAVDGRSSVTAAWARDGRVMATTCAASGRCARARALSPAGERAADARVAVASDGSAVVAWRTEDAVAAAARRGHGAFHAARVLATLAEGEKAADLAVAVGARGDAAALWTVHADGGDNVRAAVRRGKGRFLKARDLSADLPGAGLSDPDVAVDAGGNALAVWGAMTDGRPSINAAAYSSR